MTLAPRFCKNDHDKYQGILKEAEKMHQRDLDDIHLFALDEPYFSRGQDLLEKTVCELFNKIAKGEGHIAHMQSSLRQRSKGGGRARAMRASRQSQIELATKKIEELKAITELFIETSKKWIEKRLNALSGQLQAGSFADYYIQEMNTFTDYYTQEVDKEKTWDFDEEQAEQETIMGYAFEPLTQRLTGECQESLFFETLEELQEQIAYFDLNERVKERTKTAHKNAQQRIKNYLQEVFAHIKEFQQKIERRLVTLKGDPQALKEIETEEYRKILDSFPLFAFLQDQMITCLSYDGYPTGHAEFARMRFVCAFLEDLVNQLTHIQEKNIFRNLFIERIKKLIGAAQ